MISGTKKKKVNDSAVIIVIGVIVAIKPFYDYHPARSMISFIWVRFVNWYRCWVNAGRLFFVVIVTDNTILILIIIIVYIIIIVVTFYL